MTHCFFDLPVEDVVYPHIFPKLLLVDLVTLKEVAIFDELVETYLTELKEITLADVAGLDSTKLKVIANTTKNLLKLKLEGCTILDDTTVSAFLKNNKSLRHLNLSRSSLSPTVLHNLIFCKDLRKLELRSNIWVTTESIITIGYHSKQLEEIDLRECRQIDLNSIANFLPQLKTVDLPIPQTWRNLEELLGYLTLASVFALNGGNGKFYI